MKSIFGIVLAMLVISGGSTSPSFAQQKQVETIVLIRHGERTAQELGQLSYQGLNRSLALPDVLIGKYGKPDDIFAPNPSVTIGGHHGDGYSYIRPLATIEPTAIRLGMPVNTQIGYGDIAQLQDELTKPKYASSTIFVAWEHLEGDSFAKNLLKAYGADASVVPYWQSGDFDSIFVIRLAKDETGTTASFTLDHEGLTSQISATYPTMVASR